MQNLLWRLLLRALRSIPIDDSEAMRAWCQKMLAALASLAEVSPTPADDAVLALAQRILADDEAWDIFYRLLRRLIGHPTPIVLGMAAEPEAKADVDALAQRLGVPPEQVLAILECCA